MMVTEKVLTDQTEIRPLGQFPCQLRVDACIGGDLLKWKGADEIGTRVPSETTEYFYVGPQLRLVLWVGTLVVHHRRHVLTCPIGMQMHFQKRVAWTEGPAIHNLQIRGDLTTFRCAIHLVPKRDGYDETGRSRSRFVEFGPRFESNQMVVAIEKRRHID